MFGKKEIKTGDDGRPLLFLCLPRVFVEKVRDLDLKSIKEAVRPHLTDREIEAILKRKALPLAEIDDMIKENGGQSSLLSSVSAQVA